MSSIYLVLDMINDLVHPDGPNGKSPLGAEVQRRGIVARTRGAIDKARAAKVPIGYVRVGFSSGMSAEFADLFGCARARPVQARHLGHRGASGSGAEAGRLRHRQAPGEET